MSKRALLCIGVNSYDVLNVLHGAEVDAQRMFNSLRLPDVGDYDPDYSRLLLAPTLTQVREAIRELLTKPDPIDTLTFFFAGHGGAQKGSLYLCLKDADPDKLSVTAYSLSELLRAVADLQISQTNIIIDCCEGGGLVADLGGLLKTETLGAAKTPGVTILAAAALDEEAEEDSTGGVFTNAILDCIDGTTTVTDNSPTLDLLDIGRIVSPLVASTTNQTPVVWGLNLVGASSFCRNPRVASEIGVLRSTLGGLGEGAGNLLKSDLPGLWKMYIEVDRRWHPSNLLSCLTSALKSLDGHPTQQLAFIERVARTFAERAADNPDPFVVPEIYAVSALSMLQVGTPSSPTSRLRGLLIEGWNRSLTSFQRVATQAATDEFALLSPNGSSSEYFYLPIRISRLLGWCGFLTIAQSATAADRKNAEATFRPLLATVLNNYGPSVCAMSDRQAAPIAVATSAMRQLGMIDELQRTTECFLHSLATNKGIVADCHLRIEDAFTFLLERESGEIEPGSDLTARPSELIAVCLRLATIAGLQSVADDMMHELDHQAFNAYLPDNFDTVWWEVMRGGTNVCMQIGHGVWRITDFEKAWPTSKVVVPAHPVLSDCAILSSLVFPDRVAWFLIPAAKI